MDMPTILWVATVFLLGIVLASAGAWVRLRTARLRRLRFELALRRARAELEQTRDQRERLRDLNAALLAAFPRPVLITDSDRIIRAANPAALALLHLPSEQVVGRSAATVIQDYDATALLMEAARAGEPRGRTYERASTGQTWRALVTPL